MGFVQIIEFRTSRISELRSLATQMRSQSGTGAALRGTVTQDVDRPGYYLNIVEFESQQAAMENSARPEVGEFAAKMAALCDEPPRFYNLSVVETWGGDRTSSSVKKVVVAGTAAAASIAATGAGKVWQRLQEQRASKSTTPEPPGGTDGTL